MNLRTAVAAAGALVLGSIALIAGPASAAGTAYYVDNASSACNDSGAGTSASAPWCSLSKLTSHGAFTPGDQILLARGDTWAANALTLTGSGTSTSEIHLGAYGPMTTPKPIIRGTGLATDRGLRVNNASYWEIDNLDIDDVGEGLLMYFNTSGHQAINIHDMLVTRVSGIHQGSPSNSDQIWNSAGIGFTGVAPAGFTSADHMVSNVTLSDIEGDHNLNSISLDWDNGNQGLVSGGDGDNTMTNVTMTRLNLHDDDGDSRATGCDEGLRLVNVSALTVTDSILNDEGACHSASGTAAIILGRARNVTLRNNLIEYVPNTGSPDQVGIDFEILLHTITIDHNTFVHNSGAALSFLDIHPGDSQTSEVSSSNTYIQSGAGNRRGGSVSSPTNSGTISGAIYSEPSGVWLYQDSQSDTYSNFTITNNIGSLNESDVYASNSQFASTQGTSNWTYQYYNATTSSWHNLGYFDATRNIWQLSSSSNVPQISRFDIHPGVGSSTDVARAWTAPKSGTVSIRGAAFKADTAGGNGVVVSILKNGTQVWPSGTSGQAIASNDSTGYTDDLDSITVASGDVIRFVVDPGTGADNQHDLTDWAPTIAYTS